MRVPAAEAQPARAAPPITVQPPVFREAPQSICSICGQSFPPEEMLQYGAAVVCGDCAAASSSVEPQASTFDAPPGFPMVPTLSTLDIPEEAPLDPPTDDMAPPPEFVPSEEPASSDEPAPSDDDVPGDDDAIDELQEVSATISLGTRPVAQRSLPPLPVLIVVGCVGLIVTGLIVYFTVLYGGGSSSAQSSSGMDSSGMAGDQAMSEWERKNAPRLSQWRSDARGAQVSGDLAGAQLLYLRMLNLAKSPGAVVSNPALIAELAEARSNYDAITQQIGPPSADALAQAGAPPAPLPQPRLETPAASDSKMPTERPVSVVPTPLPPPPVVDTQGAGWEAGHRGKILELVSDADTLEKSKQPVAALVKLQDLLQLVGDRGPTLNDPDVKSALAAAEVSRKRLIAATRDTDAERTVTAQALLAGGLQAEQDGKWQIAMEELNDSSKLQGPMLKPVQRYRDPQYLKTLDAMAVAYMNLKLYARSNALFDEEEPLGVASQTVNSPTRELVWNRAVNDLLQKTNIMRAVKTLSDYVQAQAAPDESTINLLGTVCFIGDASNPPNRKVLDDAIGLYTQRSMDLERTRPGQRRWGIQWLPEAEAQRNFDAYNKAIDAYQTALRQRTAADAHVKDLEASGAAETAANVKNAKAQAARAAAAVKAAHDAIPSAPWLTDVQPIIPPLVDAPPPAQDASSDPNAMQTPFNPNAPIPASQPSSPGPALVAPEVRYAAAFPVDSTHLVTAAEPLGNAAQVRIEDTHGNLGSARVVAKSERLALLEIVPANAGSGLHPLDLAVDYTGGSAQCPAMPEANVFAPGVTLLTADASAPVRSAWWVGLNDHPRLPGSPLLDAQNQVIGVELAQRDDDRQRIPAVTLADLRKFLEDNQIVPGSSAQQTDPNALWQVAAESQ
jgi:tetratricopeptide (TPR) repeat protein